MSAVVQLRGSSHTCLGPAWVLQGASGASAAGRETGARTGQVELELASALAERELDRAPHPVAILDLRHPRDLDWAAQALPWLRSRGRRAVIRTAVVLSRAVLAAARSATVSLRLAHPHPEFQRLLLGGHADSASSLLLQAQHLRSLGIATAGEISPLVPGLHDDPEVLRGLARHIAAADLRSVHLDVGRIPGSAIAGLAGLDPRQRSGVDLRGLLQAYGLLELRTGRGSSEPAILDVNALATTAAAREALSPVSKRAAIASFHAARRIVEDAGLLVNACRCRAHCHLAEVPAPIPQPLATPNLFAGMEPTG